MCFHDKNIILLCRGLKCVYVLVLCTLISAELLGLQMPANPKLLSMGNTVKIKLIL